MRPLVSVIVVLCLAAFVSGQENPRQARVQAATANAVSDLLKQVESEHLAGTLAVKDVLDQTHSEQQMLQLLQKSQPIGGPRWLDDSTCQVRLEASGDAVARQLIDIAARNPRQSPIAAWEMARMVGPIAAKTYTATGNSAATGVNPLPPAGSDWAAVPAEDRQAAVADATRHAVDAVLKSIESVDMGAGHTAADALAVKGVRDALSDWIMSRPITSIDYRRSASGTSLEVQVTLSATGSDLFDVLKAILTARGEVPQPADAARWDKTKADIVQVMAPPVGTADLASANTEPAMGTTAVMVPTQPPDWAAAMIDAAGNGAAQPSALRTARAAEADALQHLRQQVMGLKLESNETMAQACQNDPGLAARLERSIAQSAKLYKVEYQPDGSVTARMSLNLGQVWRTVADHP